MRALGYQAAALALLAAGAAVLQTGPALARGAHRGRVELHLAYDRAELSHGRRFAAYDFVVSNEGADAAADVIVVHRIRPRLPVAWASWPCRVHEEAVACEYGLLRAGSARSGRIVVRLAPGGQVPRVLGRADGWETRPGYRRHAAG